MSFKFDYGGLVAGGFPLIDKERVHVAIVLSFYCTSQMMKMKMMMMARLRLA